MIQLGISEISKNPSLIDKAEEAVQIINKKTKSPKGVFIPAHMHPLYDRIMEELEYREFLRRNKNLQKVEDDTLEDGLDAF
jgi:hypothetical protein